MSADEAATVEHDEAEEHKPTGTILIAFAFLLVTAAVWLFTFYVLIDRG